MQELVSVIIPIYNVERFIQKTVKSVIGQDYKNIEIILVDDGSPDNSPEIIEEMSKSDNRIICIHKENGGVSSARNAGIKIAKGEYVTFIDGDDWVSTNYVSYLLELVKKFDCEIGMNINNYSEHSDKSSEKKYIISSQKAIEWIYLEKIFVAVWNKIYKTSFLKKNKLYFDESIWYGEGMLFNIDCLQYVNKVAMGEKCVYHQVSNPESAMRKFNVDSNICGIKSLNVQKQHWKKNNKKIEDAWNYHRRAFNLTIASGIARNNLEQKYDELYKECIYNLRHKLWISLKVDIPIKQKLVYIAWAVNPVFMANRCKPKSDINMRIKN